MHGTCIKIKKIYNLLIYQEHKYGFHNHPTNKNVFNVTSLKKNNINTVYTNINFIVVAVLVVYFMMLPVPQVI